MIVPPATRNQLLALNSPGPHSTTYDGGEKFGEFDVLADKVHSYAKDYIKSSLDRADIAPPDLMIEELDQARWLFELEDALLQRDRRQAGYAWKFLKRHIKEGDPRRFPGKDLKALLFSGADG